MSKNIPDVAALPQQVVLRLGRDDSDVFFYALLDAVRVCGSRSDSCDRNTIEFVAYLAQLLYDAKGASHA